MYPTPLRLASAACVLIASLVLSACGSQSAGTSQYHIGGTVSGLAAGASAVITDNGGDALTLTGNAPFTFATPLAGGSTYQVAVTTQPPGELCTVTGGSGVVTADVTGVAIVCTSTSRTVGGTVSGLAGGANVVITDNGGDALTLTGNAPFTFATPLTIGATYQVAVTTQPAGQVCTVTAGSGTVGSNNVTSIAVQCVSNTHFIGGTVSGLAAGATAVITDNGGDALTLTANAPFAFATPLASGSTYQVAIKTLPAGQACSVSGGSGTVGSTNVTNVVVQCVNNTHTVGGTITGLIGGTSGVLADNGGDLLTFTSNGPFTFATPVASGSQYHVTVVTQPAGQTCSVTNGDGTMSKINVTTVNVACSAPSGNWTWEGGSSLPGAAGVYGSLGVAASANVPGARGSAVSASDAAGNLWLFGGDLATPVSSAMYMNDLWKYSTSTQQWTWVSGSNTAMSAGSYGTQGTPAAGNAPSARNLSVSWVDGSGNLWVFGGYGCISVPDPLPGCYTSYLNDLWKYSFGSGQWTWVNGPNISSFAQSSQVNAVFGTQGVAAAANLPGGRIGAVSWTDPAGNLWLFGGRAYDAAGQTGPMNDLWKYTPGTGLWTWIGGSNNALLTNAGAYGTQGVAAAGNWPGARTGATAWTDPSGNLWLFGGTCVTPVPVAIGQCNDLWKYATATGQWTWIAGANTINATGTYGTLAVAAAGNTPGARYGAAGWLDAAGNFWLMGGYGFGSVTNPVSDLNDLWQYSPASGQWRWVSGSNTSNAVGVYGTLGTGAPSNVPGSRDSMAPWIDASGNLWLFGGNGQTQTALKNDLWRYTP